MTHDTLTIDNHTLDLINWTLEHSGELKTKVSITGNVDIEALEWLEVDYSKSWVTPATVTVNDDDVVMENAVIKDAVYNYDDEYNPYNAYAFGYGCEYESAAVVFKVVN